MTNSTKGRIPVFKSREEEAQFWDTHSFADYWDELKPVEVKYIKKELTEPISVRFTQDTLAKLRSEASRMGVGATTLIRMWVMERLNS
jgi:predicted DNA binding CopG/RHH family protein